MDRLAKLCLLVEQDFRETNPIKRLDGLRHSGAVAAFAGYFAVLRGLDAEICQAAGWLHDVWLYEHAPLNAEELKRHCAEGAKRASALLHVHGGFSAEETAQIAEMIRNHDDHAIEQDAYSEVLKDADVLANHVSRFGLCDTHPRLRGLLGKVE